LARCKPSDDRGWYFACDCRRREWDRREAQHQILLDQLFVEVDRSRLEALAVELEQAWPIRTRFCR
jgi:hypothetical protein